MSSDMLQAALEELDAHQPHINYLQSYYEGRQRLAFISPESRKALGDRLSRMNSNVPRLVVASIVERLRINGFSDARAWDLFVASDLDQLAPDAMADALTYGTGFVLVWAKDGKPVASIESPHQCAVLRDPADRSVIAGVKRYIADKQAHAYLYLPDEIQHWTAASGAAKSSFALAESIPNPLGAVPLVPIDNGHSEIADCLPLVDALAKLLLDMMTASEAAGKPRRWIAGLELVEKPRLDGNGAPVLDGEGQPIIDTVSPIDDVNVIQTMISESHETKFGQLPASDLTGFREGVQVIVSQISAVTSLPGHYLSPLTAAQVPSADGLRAAEASLTARCEAKQLRFGRAWEQVARLLIAAATGIAPTDIPVRVQWADAATRSEAQAADATVKLVQAGILPISYALTRLGYSEDEIKAIQAARAADFELTESAQVVRHLNSLRDTGPNDA